MSARIDITSTPYVMLVSCIEIKNLPEMYPGIAPEEFVCPEVTFCLEVPLQSVRTSLLMKVHHFPTGDGFFQRQAQ